MSCAPSIGPWSALVERLDARSTAARWAAIEPELRGLSSAGDLARWTERGQRRADRVMGALVRLAARDGGDEPDATLVVIHLLWPGLAFLVRRVRTIDQNAEDLVVGHAAIQICDFPWQRRKRRFAANLLMDIQSAVARELRCHTRSSEPREADVPLDPLRADRLLGVPGLDDDDLDINDLLTWATQTGVVAEDEARLLLEIEHAAEVSRRPRQLVADSHGWTTRTLDRRRHRALAALRTASPAYLAAVA